MRAGIVAGTCLNTNNKINYHEKHNSKTNGNTRINRKNTS